MGALLRKIWDVALGINPVLLVGALTLLGVFGLGGMVQYNQSDYFCQRCHRVRGPYVAVDLESISHKPFKEKEAKCLECHRDKDFYAWAKVTASSFASFAQDFTNPEPIRYEVPEAEDDARCLRCHYKILESNEMELLELTGKLKLIGLKFEHGRHYAIRDFDDDERARLEEFYNRKFLTEKEANELEFLVKVMQSNCAICHEPVKRTPDGEVYVDKTVNYFTQNPMTCHSCHRDALPSVHPGQKLSLPSEDTCRWCHNGLLHGRISFFMADKEHRDRTVCVKCHPAYKPDMDAELGLTPSVAAEVIQ